MSMSVICFAIQAAGDRTTCNGCSAQTEQLCWLQVYVANRINKSFLFQKSNASKLRQDLWIFLSYLCYEMFLLFLALQWLQHQQSWRSGLCHCGCSFFPKLNSWTMIWLSRSKTWVISSMSLCLISKCHYQGN